MLYEFRIAVRGRLQAVNRKEVEEIIKDSLNFSLAMHDCIDDFHIVVEPVKEDVLPNLGERFK